ncbi:hypothetical protein DCC62_12975 [candidate division KSB1 bacterium]|nr:MAG: hypothetical protein DCC62_12975 [candidate division KSB1 bacterium]
MREHLTATIRQVQSTDYESLARFFEENNKSEIKRHFHPFPLTSETAYQIACTSHSDRYYIAIRNGGIVGLCMLRGRDEGFEIPSFGIFVDHRYHGFGLGGQMTEFALDEARKLDCSTIRLSVYESNTNALNLYRTLGFREISREHLIVSGQADIKIIMIKDLC